MITYTFWLRLTFIRNLGHAACKVFMVILAFCVMQSICESKPDKIPFGWSQHVYYCLNWSNIVDMFWPWRIAFFILCAFDAPVVVIKCVLSNDILLPKRMSVSKHPLSLHIVCTLLQIFIIRSEFAGRCNQQPFDQYSIVWSLYCLINVCAWYNSTWNYRSVLKYLFTSSDPNTDIKPTTQG